MRSDREKPAAWLFDVDGTLVDSNYLHVAAWLKAFHAVGRPVEAWRIHRSIGMDSDLLLSELFGQDADRLGRAAKDEHRRAYGATAPLLAPLPGSRELLRYLAEQGSAVVLATSAPPEELAILRRVLAVDDVVAAVTDADDVDTAKPDPGIVRVALNKVSCRADDAVFVGDSIWDMKAARLAGISGIGLRSGGSGDGELLSAGAAELYDTPADLLDALVQ